MATTAEPNTQLDYLGWHLFEPTTALRPYVKSYWVLQRSQPLNALHEEFIRPGGGYGLVFNAGDPFAIDGEPLHERIFLDGSNTISRRLGFRGKVMAVGVRFHPGGAYPFVQVPLHEVSNHLLLLDVLPRQPLSDVHEQIEAAPTIPQKIAAVERWLLARLQAHHPTDPLIPHSLHQIQQQSTDFSAAQLAASLHISQRQLERLYKTQVGMPPVQYARLVRMQQARALLKTAHQLSTAQIAATLGFYDQSHFTRDFKSIVGITPHRYRQYSHVKQASPG